MKLSQKIETTVPDKVTSYVVKNYKQVLNKSTNFVIRVGNGKVYQIKPEGKIAINIDFTMVIDGDRPSGNPKNVLIWLEKNL